MIRLTENNDWVVLVLLGSILVFVVVLQYLQRESSVVKFFTQSFVDSSNIFPSYLLISLMYMLLLSTLLSSYVPIVPKFLSFWSIMGYSFSTFGFTFVAVLCFYFVKFIFSFFLYSSIGQDKKWGRLYFVSSKFYFALSLLLIVLLLIRFYFPVDSYLFYNGLLLLCVILFIFKVLFFTFNKNKILPDEWYYKFLYICTLQFIPLLPMWKLLFL